MCAVGLVILAAGGSSRLGSPKQLLLYQGRSLLRHSAEVALASVCRPVVVVLGAQAARLERELDNLPVHSVHNPQWAEGMGGSIRAGVSVLAASTTIEAAVLVLCDQPLVSPQTINALVDVHRATGKALVASEYAGTQGVPALFGRAVFDALMALPANQGAKQIFARYHGDVGNVPFPQGVVDVDTREEYERLVAGWPPAPPITRSGGYPGEPEGAAANGTHENKADENAAPTGGGPVVLGEQA